MDKLLISTLIVFFFSSQTFAKTFKPTIIYGEDNRIDVYASNDSALVELSKSTAAMIPSKNLKKNIFSGEYTIQGKTLKEDMGVCDSERFANQISAAYCSGFLVGDKYLVTAGHCIENKSDCRSNYWVFDFKMENETTINLNPSQENVYKCKKIVSHALTNNNDYALLELDRPVVNRTPLKFRKSGTISVGEPLVVMGYPSGLPLKIADGANVRSLSKEYFSANLDTYGGNSGSAVFNLDTHEVEGILVRGGRDYVYKGCYVSNRIPNDGGMGEEITYITNIKELQKL